MKSTKNNIFSEYNKKTRNEKKMVVIVGRKRLLGYVLGLAAVFLSVGFILYLYSFFSGLASYGADIIIKPSEIPRLFLFIGGILFLGIFGGFEIGRFVGSTNQKKA
jgi:arginine/ornithine N-succinyltransferase beta subunit